MPNAPLQDVYRTHHATHRKPDFAIKEEQRAAIIGQWIGEGREQLDLGCRDGQLMRHFAQKNRVTGCEIDPDAAARARERGLNVVEADLNAPLPFADASFDVVSACEVLEHLPYWGITVRQIRRVLRPGGILVGSIPLAYHLTDRWRVLRGKVLLSAKDPTHLKFFSFDALQEEFARHGFRLDAFEVIEGGGSFRSRHPRLFARNIAFRCVQTS